MTLAFIKAALSDDRFKLVGVVTDIKQGQNDDFVDLKYFCKKKKINLLKIEDINSEKVHNWILLKKPDYIFCMGYSKIIKNPLIKSFKNKIVGFHPTLLPQNRGKHPIIWSIILGLKHIGSTFFMITEKIDSGNIIHQKTIKILKSDTAKTLYDKITFVACLQLKKIYKNLKTKDFLNKKQIIKKGNLWRKRNFKDGLIDWRMSNIQIHDLIRALTKPYCGAVFLHKNKYYKVYSSEIVKNRTKKYQNIEYGKIVKVFNKEIVVKCGNGLIKLKNIKPNLFVTKGKYL